MIAALTYRLSPSRFGRLAMTSLLMSALLALSWALLAPISSAHAGQWIQRSCSFEGENIGDEGWKAVVFQKYAQSPRAWCEQAVDGGGLYVYATPGYGDEDWAGQGWSYTPPAGSTIMGGEIEAQLRVHEGGIASVGSETPGGEVGESCEYKTCESYKGKVSIPAHASEVYVRASCLIVDPDTENTCKVPTVKMYELQYSAEANISSAEFILAAKATPKASGLSGTLLSETLSGAGTLSFMATDAGPGIYQARVKVDGSQVWAGTPNENEGKCVVAGTTGGVRIFDSSQPCPTETTVHAEVHTADFADGLHTIAVELEDAAGNVSTVYSGTIITANHPASAPVSTSTSTPVSVSVFSPTTATAPPERGPCNGTPCDEAAKLVYDAGEAKTFTRPFGRSGLTLSGRLESSSGSPIKDAQVKLLQQIAGSTATTQVAETTTAADGSWTLDAPAGPSRLLSAAFYSHTLDATPASVVAFHERVQGVVSMSAPRRARLGRAVTFTGQLAGGDVPAGGESVQMEIFYGSRWRTIEVLSTNGGGRWKYKYVFTLGVGTSYRFRVVTVPNGGYPYTIARSKPVRVTVQR